MPLMNLFEPLFLLLLASSAVCLAIVAIRALSGRGRAALRLLGRVAAVAAVYFAVVIAVSALAPRKVYRIGAPQCFDDWCITVAAARRLPGADGDLEVTLRLLNRARRVPMGEKGTVVYVTDGDGRRYDPVPDASAVPLDVILEPGETREITRRFHVPAGAADPGLVYTHEGGFPIGWLIISEGGWFQQPPIVKLS